MLAADVIGPDYGHLMESDETTQAYSVSCPGPPDGDMNGIDGTNGADIQQFVDAIINGATTQEECDGDFDGINSVDVGDVPDMVSALLAP